MVLKAYQFEGLEDNLRKINHVSLIDLIIKTHNQQIIAAKNELVKIALEEVGVNVTNEEFLKENVSVVNYVGDKYDYIFLNHGKCNEKLVLKILTTPEITLETNQSSNTHKTKFSFSYYTA